MKTSVNIDARTGQATITRDHEAARADGVPIMERWELRPDQVGPHLAQFREDAAAAPGAVAISKGDADALRDVAREAERRRERGER